MDNDKIIVPPLLKDARCKPAFDYDCLTQIKGVSPLTKIYDEFDWESLERDLGKSKDALDGPDFPEIAGAFSQILNWTIKSGQDGCEMIGRRAVALAWVITPQIFENNPKLEKLAEEMGFHKAPPPTH